jgi:hypothetical protein
MKYLSELGCSSMQVGIRRVYHVRIKMRSEITKEDTALSSNLPAANS